MIDYLRSRQTVLPVVGLWIGVILVAFNISAAVSIYAPQYRVRDDYRLLYMAAQVVAQHGWPHLYDLRIQNGVAQGLGVFWQPFINPPPLVWLGGAFTWAPFLPGLIAWTAFLVLALLGAWWLAAPVGRLARPAHLVLLLGFFPVAFGLMVGQSVALVIALVAAAWRLARADRDVAAGLVLSLTAIKPQVGLLVPFCVLIAGRRRLFVTWLASSIVLAGVSVALIGPDGLQRYLAAVAQAGTWKLNQRFTLADIAGSGAPRYGLQALVATAALAAAWRQRLSLERVVAVGLIGSAAVVPYIGLQDLAALVLAGWLLIRSGVDGWMGLLLAAAYVIVELAEVVLTWPVWGVELALLLSVLATRTSSPDRRLGRDLLEPLPAAG